ncbi:hypothetical protein L210DRAFT_3650224 [Boletus edulis BED1]|uniref:3-beta hydroxysteroid dehydrogenase/isomerase domain-containing protein n=1 Tax=Boletus edulis BED1 TaxID=1328754 RepID=A0AAD4GAW0_BOLED|nr:hypothetical protein L210DRAFT_3650224 [Boletus edulis BED1]
MYYSIRETLLEQNVVLDPIRKAMISLPHSAGVVLDGKDVTSTKLFDACNDSKAKGDSEALILTANGKGDLLTVSLRPAGIFGPGQAYWRGQTRFKLEIIFYIYVGKIAEAHLAADKLVDPATSDSTSTISASTDATPLSTRCSMRPFIKYSYLSPP